MIIISDTSPITSLAAIDRLFLLENLYTNIIIPEAVAQEIVGVEPPVPGAREIQTLDWIQTRQVADRAVVASLQKELDLGESEAIALTLELNANLLLIDEHKGRTVARSLGVGVTGVLGVLLAAKARGLIPAVKPVMDDLLLIAGFWISQPVYVDVLRLANESG